MSQPESSGDWPAGSGSGSGYGSGYPPAVPPAMYPGSLDRPGAGGRLAARRRRFGVFALLLVVALGGLAVAAVGIAHGLLPRQFTAAQRRQISDWEMERRWRDLSAGKIFPASVSYRVPAADFSSTSSDLTLQAQRLAISQAEPCSDAFDPAAERILSRLGCSTVLRATYLDASGSMVATIAVAVLPGTAAAHAAYTGLPEMAAGEPGPAHPYAVAGTPGATFGDAERQLSIGVAAGPYVILSTAGFADDRSERVSSDAYVSQEMESLAGGLVSSVQEIIGKPPPEPVCPGAPAC